ncbi:aminoglycoside phosphotransferase family protein [Actinopolymorpha sp. NPDC004070]|uniref:phosphotransferase family protein n=1 Tax=Actinopolymorpha sp. NPDC004070 TaxID=3154548 RepID=UPI0033AC2D16
MSPAHQRAASVVTDFFGLSPATVRTVTTWNPTVVVKAVLADGSTVFVKAAETENVHTEAAALDHVRPAGVPTVETLGVGIDDQLPGGRWMITSAAPGRTLESVGLQTPATARTLADLAECYTRLHRVRLPGFGPLTDDGRSGTLESWSQWQRLAIEQALAALEGAHAVAPGFTDRVRDLCASFATSLDEAPGALLNAEVGDGEAFVDPATGAVTAIVDWGSALVGDPLYDLARFVAGGPADDPRPALVHPRLHAEYFARNAYDPGHARRMLRFYRFHICVIEAAWGQELGWTPSLVARAEQLLAELEPDR